jgi:threonine dehydratase
MRPSPYLEPAAIRAAHARIPAVFRDTPQFVHEGLSARAGAPVIVKLETLNPIRSFKGRGTWTALTALVEAGRVTRNRPVVCASAGNFGQGVAYAARSFDVPSVVYCSTRANPAKVARMRALGATVVEIGDAFDDARAASEIRAATGDGELLVDGDDLRISMGAATMALEVTDAAADGRLLLPAEAFVPVGNGALLIGVGSWLRHAAPECRVVGVQADRADAMTRSWHAGRPIDTATADTYADGIASRIALPGAVESMSGRVDEMRTAPEDAIRAAQAELTTELGITVEGAAAAAWAGLMSGRVPPGPVLVIVTGSNV